jgi:hypothetical protein
MWSEPQGYCSDLSVPQVVGVDSLKRGLCRNIAPRLHHHLEPTSLLYESHRTEQSYCAVIRQFIQFHGHRHPAEIGATEVAIYLTALAEEQHISASTQHVALCALTFLYHVVLAQPQPRYLKNLHLGNG